MHNYISEPTVKKPQGELDTDAFTSPGHPALEDLPLPPPHLQRAWQQRAQQAAPQEVEWFDRIPDPPVQFQGGTLRCGSNKASKIYL